MTNQEIQALVDRVLSRLRAYEKKQVLYISTRGQNQEDIRAAYPAYELVFKDQVGDSEDLEEIWVEYLSLEDAIKAGLALRTSIGYLFNHLLKGKKIVILDSCFHRDYSQASPGAKNLLAMYKKGLEDQGLIFKEKGLIRPNEEDPKPQARTQTLGKKLITEKDLEDLKPGQVVKIGQKTLVTALANDLAREKKIQLIREGSKTHAGR